jgi:hypothetical protein
VIDRHYGHLARDGREHAIKLLDLFTGRGARRPRGGRCVDVVHAVDAAWTLHGRAVAYAENATTA